MERVDVIWFGSKPPHGTNLYAGQIAQPVDDARDAALEEAASVFESAAKHNESKGRTVFAKEQRDRAARMRAAMRANDSAAEGGAK